MLDHSGTSELPSRKLPRSGIKMDSWLPWQNDTVFHDQHHEFFHVNYGQNLQIWDRLNGTVRDPSRFALTIVVEVDNHVGPTTRQRLEEKERKQHSSEEAPQLQIHARQYLKVELAFSPSTNME